MFDRLALRTPFWGVITILAFAAVGLSASASFDAVPNFVEAAPLLSAAALIVAIAGWRLLHRELLHRMQEDESLRDRVRRLQDAMQSNVDGMFLLRAVRTAAGEVTDFEIADVNSSGAATLYRTREQLVGRRIREELPTPLADMLFERYVHALTLRTAVVEELRVDRRAVAASWLFHQATPTADGLAVTVRDVSSRKRDELRMRKACLTDDLTRLYNRRGFMALAEQHLRIARRQGKDAVVMYVDMDEFKQLNDSHGHATGDRALMAVSRLLRSTVRDCDVVARMGGDEFTILALDADVMGARAIQKRLDERLALFNASGELPMPLSLTVGHTRVRPSDTSSVSELLARADQLLYARKRRRQLTKAAEARHREHAPQRAPRRAPQLTPMPIPAEVAAIARAAAMALPNAASPMSSSMATMTPPAVAGTFLPTHAA
ncbi:GGDEF domain-containing protein [Gemmatimonas groenlandica]|uniref:Diguanylate cyclase n=1 Tax=Gemmatimonas groenlandica TaxID=2732249 RepID=A0A6M4IRV8_9BACT|nr:sensor domain-containing diguanylate cyclase [Gemmatimonas groenlandica]QJR35572.1 diguanylate cyclase [Gemmatimonas groenlandica]